MDGFPSRSTLESGGLTTRGADQRSPYELLAAGLDLRMFGNHFLLHHSDPDLLK